MKFLLTFMMAMLLFPALPETVIAKYKDTVLTTEKRSKASYTKPFTFTKRNLTGAKKSCSA